MQIRICTKCNKVRGFLCSGCNSALGYAKDSPIILRKLADYLEKYDAWD